MTVQTSGTEALLKSEALLFIKSPTGLRELRSRRSDLQTQRAVTRVTYDTIKGNTRAEKLQHLIAETTKLNAAQAIRRAARTTGILPMLRRGDPRAIEQMINAAKVGGGESGLGTSNLAAAIHTRFSTALKDETPSLIEIRKGFFDELDRRQAELLELADEGASSPSDAKLPLVEAIKQTLGLSNADSESSANMPAWKKAIEERYLDLDPHPEDNRLLTELAALRDLGDLESGVALLNQQIKGRETALTLLLGNSDLESIAARVPEQKTDPSGRNLEAFEALLYAKRIEAFNGEMDRVNPGAEVDDAQLTRGVVLSSLPS